MNLDPNSLSTNIYITVLVAVLVVALPRTDRAVCRRLGLNLEGGLSKNPNTDRLLHLRRLILWSAFGLYLAAVAWLVFFSRSASMDYQVHIALFEDLRGTVHIDLGVLDFIRLLFTEGFSSALSHISITKPENIAQVYMNIMLFVPLGYLLPYVSDWFRARCNVRPAAACILCSFAIENLQLITKRGFYDMDDLIANSLGGLIGQSLFLTVAYVVTHPDWRTELSRYRRWKRNARRRTLYPFAHRIALSRTALLATDETAVYDFYIMKLGFRLRRQLVPEDSEGTSFLLEMGKMQLEIRCSNGRETLPEQYLTISVSRLAPVRKRLTGNGITVGPDEQDPYTGKRCLHFTGPDGVQILVLER